jgi:hypothetical protein
MDVSPALAFDEGSADAAADFGFSSPSASSAPFVIFFFPASVSAI